jgi:hypothetical protein
MGMNLMGNGHGRGISINERGIWEKDEKKGNVGEK